MCAVKSQREVLNWFFNKIQEDRIDNSPHEILSELGTLQIIQHLLSDTAHIDGLFLYALVYSVIR